MGFDVFAQAFRDGDAGFADAAAARAILSQTRHEHDPQFDSYDVELPDEYHLEMYAGGLDGKKPFDGALFAHCGISDAIGDFILRFARAAGCVLLPAMKPACALLTDESQSQHLPPVMRAGFQVITISSGAELVAALEGGYDTWRAYRDRIVGDAAGGT
jgi:hypothetical protein